MTLEELTRSCPALADTLAQHPDLRAVAQRITQAELAGALTRYLDDASAQTITGFLRQVADLDLERIHLHRRVLEEDPAAPLQAADVEPVELVTLEQRIRRDAADAHAGMESLSGGRWAAVAFAGGSGTRFFSGLEELEAALAQPNEILLRERFDPAEPKGLFPISPVGGLRFIDQILAEAIQVGVRTGRLPWVLLLTSSQTHTPIVRHLRQAPLWGFPAAGWLAFSQADEPRLDERGDLVVVDDSGALAFTGDGHGGVYRALLRPGPSGLSPLERIREDGVQQLVMFNVDNAAARPFAPARLGFHTRENALFTVSATRKTDPQEKVGVLMRLRASGRLEVVEYNVIPPEIAGQIDPHSGRLLHEAGNINTNLVAVEAVRPNIDPTLYTGKRIDSRRGPVATSSLEMLNQHLTRKLDPSRVRAYEVERGEFFLPTKNAIGPDSVVTTVAGLARRHAARLRAAGARLDETALCDLHPACGDEPQRLSEQGLGPDWELEPAARLYLCCGPEDPEQGPIGEGRLRLESGASLVVDCERPWGDLHMRPDRRLTRDLAAASRVRLGAGLVVRAGVRVRLRVGRGARLQVRPGTVFDTDVDLTVGPGRELDL